MFDFYDWPRGREAIVRMGKGAAALVIAPALFEEANRLRAFTLALMRALAARGIASALPDLPGQGESLWASDAADLDDWRSAFAAAVPADALVLSMRGGALVDAAAAARARYHFAPVTGAALVRDLLRVRRMATLEGGDRFDLPDPASPGGPIEVAGNPISRTLLSGLERAFPAPAKRTVRLDSDAGAAEAKLSGRPLWRASEPGIDRPLADALAADVAAWIVTCGG